MMKKEGKIQKVVKEAVEIEVCPVIPYSKSVGNEGKSFFATAVFIHTSHLYLPL